MTSRPATQAELPKGETRLVSVPTANRAGALQPSTWDAENRTIDVIWTLGTRRAKFDWASMAVVDEELAVSATNVRLDRLNAGAPVLDNHRREALNHQIGVVMPGTARIENGRGTATLKLSDRSDIAPIVADIASGIIRNISVGYTVHAYDVEQRKGAPPLYRAVDWEPFEISFVTVPADTGAQVRSTDPRGDQPCTLRFNSPKESTMPRNNVRPAFETRSEIAPSNSGQASLEELRELFEWAWDTRDGTIDQRNALILDYHSRGLSMADVSKALGHTLAAKQRNETGNISNIQAFSQAERGIIGGENRTFDNPAFHGSAIEDAIYARMSGATPTDQARQFMGMSMVDMARDLIERGGVRNARSMSPNDVLSAATWNRGATRSFVHNHIRGDIGGMHTVSDFPDLLSAAGARFLQDVFQAAASPLKMLGRMRNARDFREISGLQMSAFGTLPEVQEAGEIKHGTFVDRKEKFQLKTFAKQFALSRQAIINDDLGAFSDPLRIMGRSAAETEASLLADLINRNPEMADGRALFHADHGNLASPGSAPSIEALDAGRKAMRRQKDLDGTTPISAAPKYVVANEEHETALERLLIASTNATTPDEANPFAGKLLPLIDPRLDVAPWYLFADPALAPVLEYAYLNGNTGPHVETKEGWDTLGTSFRIYMDFGAGLIDHRGGYKNLGSPG